MARAGFLLIVIGVAGLFVPGYFTIPADTAGVITGGSWVAVGVGAVLILTAMARAGAGPGIFPLAGGIGALVAQLVTHWIDAPGVQAWQPWLGFGLILLIGVGAFGVVVSMSDLDDESAVAMLLLFAIASLVTDIIFDFGEGWDELMNVSTVVFAACFVLGAVIRGTSEVDLLHGPSRRKVMAAYEPGWGHPVVRYPLLEGARLVVGGYGLTAVLITTMTSFSMPTFVDVLLTLPAVLGVYTIAPMIGYVWVVRAVGPERFVRAGTDALDEVFDHPKLGVQLSIVLGAAYLGLTSLVVLVFFGPAAWLAALLVIAAIGAGVVAARYGLIAFPELIRHLVRASEAPERNAPSVADLLGTLGRSDPVFRLLPGSDQLAPARISRETPRQQ